MHFPPIGYLFSILNMSSFGGTNHQLKDLAIKVDCVKTVVEEIFNQYPDFPLENYRNSQYQRIGNIGIFFSKKAQEYMFEGNAKNKEPCEEGVGMILEFEQRKESTEEDTEEQEHHVLLASKHLHPDTAKTFLEYVNDKGSKYLD